MMNINAAALLIALATALAAGAAVYKALMGKYAPESGIRRLQARTDGARKALEVAGDRAMGALRISRTRAGKTASALRRAGIDAPVGTFYAASLASTVAGAAIGIALMTCMPDADAAQRIAALVVALAAGAIAPWAYVRRRGRARLAKIEASLPTILELLAVSAYAGQTVERAVRTVGERGSGPLAEEFAACARDVSDYGYTTSDALGRLAERVGSPGVTGFCSAARQSLESGSEIAPVLKAQARMAADEYYLSAEERANKLPGKLVIITVLFIMPLTIAVSMLPTLLTLMDSMGGLM